MSHLSCKSSTYILHEKYKASVTFSRLPSKSYRYIYFETEWNATYHFQKRNVPTAILYNNYVE